MAHNKTIHQAEAGIFNKNGDLQDSGNHHFAVSGIFFKWLPAFDSLCATIKSVLPAVAAKSKASFFT